MTEPPRAEALRLLGELAAVQLAVMSRYLDDTERRVARVAASHPAEAREMQGVMDSLRGKADLMGRCLFLFVSAMRALAAPGGSGDPMFWTLLTQAEMLLAQMREMRREVPTEPVAELPESPDKPDAGQAPTYADLIDRLAGFRAELANLVLPPAQPRGA